MVRKKILIGSIFVLALMLLMPSIPAVQQNTIEEGIKQDIQEKIDSLIINDFRGIKELIGDRHPILFAICLIMVFMTNFRITRSDILFFYSTIYVDGGWNPGYYEITHPLIFIRSLWLFFTGAICSEIAYLLNEIYGWI